MVQLQLLYAIFFLVCILNSSYAFHHQLSFRNVVCAYSFLTSGIKSGSMKLKIPAIAKGHLKTILLYSDKKKSEDAEEVTKKYGFEVGMFKALTNKDSTIKPKDLLKKYGVAYLITSITLAIISFTICYALVSQGVDVPSLLSKVGIKSDSLAVANAGTVGIAYAVHKAASPIRFPPTVALTPIVANLIGRKDETN